MTTLIATLNEISAPWNPVLTAGNVTAVGHCKIISIQFIDVGDFQQYIDYGLC
ncbi:hypothetical protein D3C72_2230620 [compost metagenome]